MKTPKLACPVLFWAAIISVSCTSPDHSSPESADEKSADARIADTYTIPTDPEEREKEIRKLIEQLVIAEGTATGDPVIHPDMAGDDGEAYRDRFQRCQTAFRRLSLFKDQAFPIMVEHLEDTRQSIPFRNHYVGQSVGDACRWNIYFQLQDRPGDYSEYGHTRKGKDGQNHVKPYWEGTPFDESGGLAEWLKETRDLSYVERQIKCLRWLLEKEKAIGASDADSYFVNILPLEIRILERRQEAGEEVSEKLNQLRRVQSEKLEREIPPELLPARP